MKITIGSDHAGFELKKSLISKMSLMNSPEISDYMMEILNK